VQRDIPQPRLRKGFSLAGLGLSRLFVFHYAISRNLDKNVPAWRSSLQRSARSAILALYRIAI
ncbi:MAG: hypothetical protein OSB46_01715, partial [Alphaproteobacteria bacterium]|nr:hypothetical protein [Alphaproteobacteria bacterium]